MCRSRDMDPAAAFGCGQCFRWNRLSGDSYLGIASGRIAVVSRDGCNIMIEAAEEDMPFWRGYFDLGTDYAEARRSVEVCEYMRECAEYGSGIRIFRQDSWEALISFIISQCNNIPRIKGIVEKLCSLYGGEIEYRGEIYHKFPTPERLAALSEEDLLPIKAGYRAAYIISAADAVNSGALDLDSMQGLSAGELKSVLMSLRGVGRKVADCVVLFGFHKMDAFPVDTWMKKALKAHFPADFRPESLGPYAGLAQQYIFYHAREAE